MRKWRAKKRKRKKKKDRNINTTKETETQNNWTKLLVFLMHICLSMLAPFRTRNVTFVYGFIQWHNECKLFLRKWLRKCAVWGSLSVNLNVVWTKGADGFNVAPFEESKYCARTQHPVAFPFWFCAVLTLNFPFIWMMRANEKTTKSNEDDVLVVRLQVLLALHKLHLIEVNFQRNTNDCNSKCKSNTSISGSWLKTEVARATQTPSTHTHTKRRCTQYNSLYLTRLCSCALMDKY